MQRLYIGSTRVLSVLMLVLGLALITAALVRGGGPAALGVLVGAGLAVSGALRLWLMRGIRDDAR